jgi:hypothetical protein
MPGEREFASGVTETQGILDADVMLHGFHTNFQRPNRLLNVMIIQVTLHFGASSGFALVSGRASFAASNGLVISNLESCLTDGALFHKFMFAGGIGLAL